MKKLTKKQINIMKKSCLDCWYKKNNPDGGFCYMFEEKLPNVLNYCGQFRDINYEKAH